MNSETALRLGRAGEAVEEPADELGRERADELVDDVPVLECLDGGDALHPIAEREFIVGVDVDLRQHDLALAGGGLALEHGAEHPAGAAPGGPEVDDHGQLVRALDHLAFERLGAHIHRVRSSFIVSACAVQASTAIQLYS